MKTLIALAFGALLSACAPAGPDLGNLSSNCALGNPSACVLFESALSDQRQWQSDVYNNWRADQRFHELEFQQSLDAAWRTIP